MKIQSIQLKSFKRFTDLTIQGIPETAKLVIIAGPNGCGKSSLFDGLTSWHRRWKGQGSNWNIDYHQKSGGNAHTANPNQAVMQAITVNCHGTEPTDQEERKKALYVRTAYRNDPQFKLSELRRSGSQLDENRFDFLMQNDAAVSNNLSLIHI